MEHNKMIIQVFFLPLSYTLWASYIVVIFITRYQHEFYIFQFIIQLILATRFITWGTNVSRTKNCITKHMQNTSFMCGLNDINFLQIITFDINFWK